MKLTSNARNQLRSAEFAVPERRSYPIPDETHARNALSRVAQFGSAHEQARVRAAVHHKFHAIGAQPSVTDSHKDKHKSIGHRIMAIGRRY
ncbi:MAG TPA: hypothetical protein VI685_17555 [Candidatus Angelobacter sp.]